VPTTLADVVDLRQRNAAVVKLSNRALDNYWSTLDLSKPEAARDALVEFVPQLVGLYGQAAATVAADWYENIRARDVDGTYSASLADSPPAEQVQESVRYQAGQLFTDNPESMLVSMSGAVQRYVVNTGRETIRANAGGDPAKPRYARIPTGAKTCAFCSLLASRGFVYASESTAGEFDKYHHKCDCQAVADFSDDPRIEGYDPAQLYDLYQSARAATPGKSINEIAAEMRRQFPDKFTDGIGATRAEPAAAVVRQLAKPIEKAVEKAVQIAPDPAPAPEPAPEPAPFTEVEPVVEPPATAAKADVVVKPPATEPHRFTDVADMKQFGERMGQPSGDAAKAVKEYTTGTSGDINSVLRGGRSKFTNQKKLDSLVRDLDAAMKDSTVPEDVVVYRGTKLIAFGGKSPDAFIGKVLSDKAYLSTSMAGDVSAIGKGEAVHFEIRVPKGTKAVYAAGVSAHKAEKELLLDRNSGLAIESAVYNERTRKWRVVATVVQKSGKKK
jgi:hypothetical protein